MLRIILLFPFSMVYKAITSFRNLLFDLKYFKETPINIQSIGVGNLTVGGTGKTPTIAYLIEKLSDKHLAVLSRGYGRKTSGFVEIKNTSTPKEVGDEPLMLYKKYQNKAKFFVCEKRVLGYRTILEKYPETETLLLDDVFQHRHIKPQKLILLCDYSRPFFEDYLLPSGNLREAKSGAKRASVVLVTKCPNNLSEDQKKHFKTQIDTYTKAQSPVFFSEFKKSVPTNYLGEKLTAKENCIIVAALAKNEAFYEEWKDTYIINEKYFFNDHHSYTKENVLAISSENKKVITTEKDFVKIENQLSEAQKSNFYIVKLSLEVQNEEGFLNALFA
ncbi:tetraacyldisaccharide 4'-kinase [Lacihabitans lacunae]|uniref:Tetraacyldisaccharide 4'-kinase n=1 Tax=Lacihabitans lacunae TaxID=1028214 RepID=A0ABV7YUI1_9BACT